MSPPADVWFRFMHINLGVGKKLREKMRCCSAAYAATNDANPRCPGESRDASAGERQQDGASPHHRARSLFHTFFQVFFADGLLDYVRSTRFQNGVDPRDLVMYWAYCAS
jgi:hypothetical protein